MKKVSITLLYVFIALITFAQGEADVNKTFMSSNLKINVVIAVLTIILGLLFLFLFSMERRLKQLEKK
ncbi:MAG: CcmD family protein [Bacteroidetes bacterium]|nr:CcmD family protein [Bacteroidota bacterium]MBK8658133.1 CcmD family protein [Bacteroidota bacterium]